MRFAIFALLLPACTSVISLRRPDSPQAADALNQMLPDGELRVITSGKNVTALAAEVGVATASWTEPDTRLHRTVPTAALRSIELPRKHGLGALEGAALGTLIGAGAGIAAGLASGDDRCDPNQWCIFRLSAGQKAGYAAIALGALGLLIGTLTGAAIGHGTTIEFN